MAYVRVYVWLGKGLAYKLGAGHGAAEIVTPEGHKYYITLYNRGAGTSGRPGVFPSQSTEANKVVGFAQIRNKAGQVVDNPHAHGTGQALSYHNDCDAYGCAANHTFEVPISVAPATASTDPLFGVSVHRMERFWKRILLAAPGHPMRRYAALSTHNNCNGVVVDALLEGGLGHYAAPPSNFVYQDARTLIQWVEKAVERINDMNNARYGLLETFRIMRRVPQRTIPNLQEWKKASDEGIAFFARRKEQIEKIDEYLRLYHWAAKNKNKAAQVRALNMAQRYIYSHLTRKPNSDRREAVRTLAARINAVLEDLFIEHDHAEVATNLNTPPDSASSGEDVVYQVI